MKIGKIVLIILCAALAAFVLGITGTVHVADSAETESKRLVGLLITQEPLDLYDSEAALNEALDRFTGDGELILDNRNGESQRLYAVLTESEFTDEETGETFPVRQYLFENVKGYRILAPWIDSPEVPSRSTDCDDAFTECDFSFNTLEDGEAVRIEGTLNVIPDGLPDTMYYFNPVCQLSTGEVFAVAGEGMSFGGMQAGSSFGMTISDRQTSTVDGKETTDTFEACVNIRGMEAPLRITVAQFGGDDALLEKTDFVPGELPESLSPLPDAQYLLVETLSTGPDGAEHLSRALVQREDDLFTAYSARDGVCVPQTCAVDWP